MDYSQLAADKTVVETAKHLTEHGMETIVVPDAAAAKAKVLSLLPKGAEVMTMQSMTLRTAGITDAIDTSPDYVSVRNKLSGMNRETDSRQMQIVGAAPAYAVGSVHAVVTDGTTVVVSNTGSQLPAYAYGADHVIWVVGTQKIVPSLDEAMKRIYDYVLPLESARLNEQYHMTAGSFVSKILVFHREIKPGRITILLVKEKLGF